MRQDEASEQLGRLASDHQPMYEDARRWFLEQGEAAAAHLVEGLDDPGLGSVGHWRILLVLRELRAASTLPAILKAFRKAFDQDNPIVLPGAMEALAVFDDEAARSALISALASSDPDTVNHAAALLAQAGGRSAEQAIAGLLGRASPAFRQSAVSALLKMNTPSAREILERHRQKEQDPAVLKLFGSSR
jgi:HEAT repeat protein